MGRGGLLVPSDGWYYDAAASLGLWRPPCALWWRTVVKQKKKPQNLSRASWHPFCPASAPLLATNPPTPVATHPSAPKSGGDISHNPCTRSPGKKDRTSEFSVAGFSQKPVSPQTFLGSGYANYTIFGREPWQTPLHSPLGASWHLFSPASVQLLATNPHTPTRPALPAPPNWWNISHSPWTGSPGKTDHTSEFRVAGLPRNKSHLRLSSSLGMRTSICGGAPYYPLDGTPS